ncbi:TPA: transposase [Vibrio vulnificus]|nr:transposase [Vibrio vulnificus]HDY7488987.1 transposase [Vibrio vulnificus]HDY7951726.1 transposase [Vibrio vulnificus]HDY8192398.1 transposase [Vibrio vulnificus]
MCKLVHLFCHVDDFFMAFLPQWQKLQLESGERKRNRKGRMCESEIMTIIIAFHMSHQRDFKNFYLGIIYCYYKNDFPTLFSYTRFREVMPSMLIPLSSFFTHVKGTAARGKGTIGWFYGFKLHIITNHLGNIVAAKLTPANTDDRKPVRELSKGLLDKLYADKGYISKALTDDLKEDGIILVTTQRKNMKPRY